MGFEQDKINWAWGKADIKTVEGIINYMDANEYTPAENKMEIEDDKPKTNQGVEGVVKREVVEEVMKQGHSQLIAEKAVILSGNTTAEAALAWIKEHEKDADFSEPIIIEKPKSNLTPEEAKRKAKELQAELRKKALEREKQDELEREKQRIKMGKELTEARRIQEEQKKKRELNMYLKEREKDEADKQKMLQVLEEDKKRRLGDKYNVKNKAEKTTKEKFNDIYDKMYKIYRMGQLDILRVCIKTLGIYIKNLIKDPANPKFTSINASNANFCKRVKDVIGGEHMLGLVGFVLVDGMFVIDKPDMGVLKEVAELLNDKLTALQTM